MQTTVNLPRSGLIITLRCNLKCRLCGGYIPYYVNPPHWEYSFVAKVIDKYFEIVDTVGDFDISGGETFLHPELDKIILKALTYSERYSRLLILTNGTIVPSDNIIEILKSSEKIMVTISDYGLGGENTQQLIRTFQDNRIKHRVIDYNDDLFCNGWVNYDAEAKLWHTEEELVKQGEKCAVRNRGCNFLVQNGEIHSCGRSYRRMETGIIPKDDNEYVNLLDDTISIEQKKIKVNKILRAPYGTSCAFCNGLCKDSPRYRPAEQLTKEELECIKKGAQNYTQICNILNI